MRLYIGLIHYPVYNKNHEIIASAITPMDLHDIARSAKTYDVKKFFVVTPLDDQQGLAEQVRRHWTKGYGARYNRHRKEAIELLSVVSSLKGAVEEIVEIEGMRPLLIATDASEQRDRMISYASARALLLENRVVILLFGTAWGLEKAVLKEADHILAPILGKRGYNHLSVRTAAAIILDRLVGDFE
ncbi:MAG: RNA methyltransferase [Desulfobacteraceae bacterium]|nr:RNA methyltransferase [Desulfobacteraceae bacterium]